MLTNIIPCGRPDSALRGATMETRACDARSRPPYRSRGPGLELILERSLRRFRALTERATVLAAGALSHMSTDIFFCESLLNERIANNTQWTNYSWLIGTDPITR